MYNKIVHSNSVAMAWGSRVKKAKHYKGPKKKTEKGK